jgi:pilus assembly protein CpaB
MLIVAAMVGLVTVFLASRLLAPSSKPTTQVVVASGDITLGQRISASHLHTIQWPTNEVPAGSFSDPAQLEGRVLKDTVVENEPIVEKKLAPKGTTGGLSAIIAPGSRAMTVRVNDVIGVAGFALPGNYVDIIVNTQVDPNLPTRQSISKTVLEKVLVLAVAQEAGRDSTTPKVVNAVTLQVTPEQAEEIDLARSIGTLSLVLRNQVDTDPASTAGATRSALLGAPPPPPKPVRRAPARNCINAMTGTRMTKECL